MRTHTQSDGSAEPRRNVGTGPRTTVKLRLSEAELSEWKAAAAENEETLSEWVRGCCNSDVEARKEFDASRDRENLRRTGGDGVDLGRTGASDGTPSIVPRPTAEADDAVGAGQAERFRRNYINTSELPAPKYGTACQHGAGPGLCRYSKCHNYPGKRKSR